MLLELAALRFFTNKWSYLLIYITFANKNYIPKLSIRFPSSLKFLGKSSAKWNHNTLTNFSNSTKNKGCAFRGQIEP